MPVQILVGTTSGNTEFLAQELNDQLQQQNIATVFHDEPAIHEVPLNQPWLLCIATHGAGDYAESIDSFMQHLAEQRPNLSQVKFALIGIGDSSYDTFCQAGDNAEKLLTELGAQALFPPLAIDMLYETDPEQFATDWLKNWVDRISA